MSPDPAQELQLTLRTLANISGFGDMSAQEFGDLTRAVIYRERDRYAYGGGYEPKAVFDDDPFDAMSHEEIFGKVEQFQPERAGESSDNWRAIGAHAAEGADQFAQAMATVNSTSWQGPSATAAVDGVHAYTKSTAELKTTAHLVANKLLEAYTGLQQTKASVPPPLPTGPFEKVLDATPGFLVPGALKQAQHAREEAEEAARQVMRSVYMPVVHQSDDQVPILPTALDPVTDGGAGGASGYDSGTGSPGFHAQPFPRSDVSSTGSGGGASGQTGSPASDSSALRSAASDARGTATEASSWAPGEAPQSAQPSTGPAGAQHGSNAPSGSAPAGSSPGSSVLGSPLGGQRASDPRASGPGSSSPRGGGTGSRFGGGSGGSGSGGSGSRSGIGGFNRPGVGGSVLGAPGQGGAAAGSQGSTGGSSAAAGRTGAPGMGGMAPGAGRGGPGGADDVHKTPGYLVDAVNGDELIGTLPLVVPPVLGG